tara:strand:- start:1607 stop:2662 length:1056 start_codon:yes stop_codon:yes gene_type:complete
MALRPEILLRGQVPDTGAAVQGGLQNAALLQGIQQKRALAPLEQQLQQQSTQANKLKLDQATKQAQEMAAATAFNRDVLPFIDKDIDQAMVAISSNPAFDQNIKQQMARALQQRAQGNDAPLQAIINASNRQLGVGQKPVSALDAAKTRKAQAEAESIEAETDRLRGGSKTDQEQLKVDKIKLEIQNLQAVHDEKKSKAVQAATDRDSSSVAKAFDAQSGIDAVDSLLNNDTYRAIYGFGDEYIPTLRPASVEAEAFRDQVVGLLSLENRQKLKGQGTITDQEATTLKQSATILAKPGIRESAAEKELKRVRSIFDRAKKRAEKNPVARKALLESRFDSSPAQGIKFLGFE